MMFRNHPHICQFLLVLVLFTLPVMGQDLESVVDATPEVSPSATATSDPAIPGTEINWDEIVFEAPPTAAQVFASQAIDLQSLGITEGQSPFGILLQIIRHLAQNFSPVPPTGTTTPPVSSTAATGTLNASSPASVPPGTAGTSTSEGDFATRAQTIIDELKAKGAKPGSGIGDSPAKLQIGGFPSWFGELQSLIVSRRTWSDLEERGRKLLGEYAAQWSKTNVPQPTPHGLTEFYKYLGCCETNDEAIRQYDATLPRSGDFFGSKGGVNWCAFASNRAYMQPMMDAGFKFAGDYAWANNTKYIPQYGRGHPKFSVMPGDYISNGTHVMTVLQVNGDKVTVVSGNAGGGPENGAGTVRIEEISYGKIEVVKKHSDFTLETLQSHADDEAWLKAHGITRR